MTKEELELYVNEGLTQRAIAIKLSVSQATVKHFLNKFELRTLRALQTSAAHLRSHKQCNICLVDKPLSDYHRADNHIDGVQSRCKSCNSADVNRRQKEMRMRMIAHKGNQCEACTLKLKDSHYSVFEFHHKDPSSKDPNFKTIRSRSWSIVQKEIENCSLLCANCHRIAHVRLRELSKDLLSPEVETGQNP